MVASGKGRRHRDRCDPRCPAGQSCDRATRTCTCDNQGTVCGDACCTEGQTCSDGQCTTPPQTCIPAGSPCKGIGRACCEGTVCASGQGGQADVACRVPAGGRCGTTADCVWFSECEGGVCVDRQPTPTPVPPACVPAFPPGPDARANGAALQAAIDAAPDGGTVLLAPGVYEHLMDAPLEYGKTAPTAFFIARPLTIRRCGDGNVVLRSIEANWSTLRIIDSGPVELDGLTITDAGSPGRDGRGVQVLHTYIAGAPTPQLSIRNCIVEAVQGAGIECSSSPKIAERIPLRIEGCTIEGNLGFGGAGGGIEASRCSLDVRDSRIVRNVAHNGDGGGFALYYADLDLRDSEVSGNTAGSSGLGQGGGIFVSGASTLIVRAGSTVTSNTAALGGGVYVEHCGPDPAVTIADGTVFGNVPAVPQIYDFTCP